MNQLHHYALIVNRKDLPIPERFAPEKHLIDVIFTRPQVSDYPVTAEVEGVRDTAAIRVAATLIPEGITGSPQQREPRRKALFVGIQYAGTPGYLDFMLDRRVLEVKGEVFVVSAKLQQNSSNSDFEPDWIETGIPSEQDETIQSCRLPGLDTSASFSLQRADICYWNILELVLGYLGSCFFVKNGSYVN